MEKSQNGWPASKDPAAIKVGSYLVPGTKIKLRVAQRCAPLLIAFAAEFHNRVEPIDEGSLDDWGFNYRPIRGQTTGLSNHSSASAIDLNSSKHPLGKRNTFTASQRDVLDELCAKYKIKGGYTFIKRADDMHFEMACSPSEATAHIKALKLEVPQ
jgi:hypothetical protein